MHFHFGGRRNPFGRHVGFMGGFGGLMGGAGGFRAARMLGADDLQLIILMLLREKPRHGYEIIKELEERSSGFYTPSPGVVYPALTYLEEMGYAISESEGNKKFYRITETGADYLEKNRSTTDETLEQLARFGRKMARVQKHFAEEEAENDFDDTDLRSQAKDEWRKLKFEFHDLKQELKAVLREKINAPLEEKKRVLEVLKHALEEIRGK